MPEQNQFEEPPQIAGEPKPNLPQKGGTKPSLPKKKSIGSDVGNQLNDGITPTSLSTSSLTSISEGGNNPFSFDEFAKPQVQMPDGSGVVVNKRAIPIPYTNEKQYAKDFNERKAKGVLTPQDEIFIQNNVKANLDFSEDDKINLAEISSKYGIDNSSLYTVDLLNTVKQLKDKITNGTQSAEAPLQFSSSGVATIKPDFGKAKGDSENDFQKLNDIQRRLFYKKNSEDTIQIFEDVNIKRDNSGNIKNKFLNRVALTNISTAAYGKLSISQETENAISKQPEEFSIGLNLLKYTDPEQYKRVFAMLEKDEPLSESLVANVTAQGIDSKEYTINKAFSESKLTNSEYADELNNLQKTKYTNLIGNKEVYRSFLANGVAELADADNIRTEGLDVAVKVAQRVFGHRWNYEDNEIENYAKAYAQANGIDPENAETKAAIKYLQDNEGAMILENSIAKSALVRDLGKGLAQPIRGISNTIEDLGKPNSDIFNEGQSQGNVIVSEQRLKRLEHGWEGAISDIVEGTGQFITQAGLAAITSGGIGLGAKAIIGEIGVATTAGEIVGTSAKIGSGLLKSKDAIATVVTSYAQSYDSNLKQALAYTSDDNKAKITANILSVAEGAIELWLSPLEIARGIKAKLFSNKGMSKGIIGVLSDAAILDKNAAIKNLIKASMKGGLETGRVVLSEIGEENLTQSIDYAANAILNPDSKAFEDRDLAQEVLNTSYKTGLAMVVPALLSGAGSYKVNNFSKGSLLVAGQNRQHFIDQINTDFSKGLLAEDEKNEKIAIINTAAAANANIPTAANGNKLNSQDKADYVYSRVSEGVLNKKIEESTDEAEKSELAKRVKEQQDFRKQMIGRSDIPVYKVNGKEVGKDIFDIRLNSKNVDSYDLEVSNDIDTQNKLREIGGKDAENKTTVLIDNTTDSQGTKGGDKKTLEVPTGNNIPPPTDNNGNPISQLTDEENAAIEGFKGVDFGEGGVTNWTNVIQSESATQEEKKQAIKELGEQLADKRSEVPIGEALGKSADLIYAVNDANKIKPEDGISIKEVAEPPTVSSEDELPSKSVEGKEVGSNSVVEEINARREKELGTVKAFPSINEKGEKINVDKNKAESEKEASINALYDKEIAELPKEAIPDVTPTEPSKGADAPSKNDGGRKPAGDGSFVRYNPDDVLPLLPDYKSTNTVEVENYVNQVVPNDASVEAYKTVPIDAIQASENIESKDRKTIDKIKEGIKNGDDIPPLVLDFSPVIKNGEAYKFGLMDGHHRYIAYKELGIKEVPAAIVTSREHYTFETNDTDVKTLFNSKKVSVDAPLVSKNDGGNSVGGDKLNVNDFSDIETNVRNEQTRKLINAVAEIYGKPLYIGDFTDKYVSRLQGMGALGEEVATLLNSPKKAAKAINEFAKKIAVEQSIKEQPKAEQPKPDDPLVGKENDGGNSVWGEVMPKEISDLYSEAASLRFTLNALKQQMGGKILVGKAKAEYENTKTRLDNIELKLSEYEQSKSQSKPKSEKVKKEKVSEIKQTFDAGEEANYYDDLFDKTDKVKILYKTGDGENGTERYQVQFENGQEATIWSDKLQPLKEQINPDASLVGKEEVGSANYKKGDEQLRGRTITKTIANGEKITGTYKVVSADDVIASHNEETFSQSGNFPQNKDGKTVNDRDYNNDKNAQSEVIKIAQNLDDRAVTQTPVVSKDGIVLDGNNRTMSRKLAAKRGTDKAYLEALKEQAELYGIDANKLDGIKNPMLVFETETNLPYTTETFKKFNAQEKKEKSPVEKAVEISKVITDKARRVLFGIYGDAESPSDITSVPKSIKQLINLFQSEGLLQSNEIPRYFDAEKLTATKEGVAFLENVLLGSALKEDAIRTLDIEGMGNIRRKVLGAIIPLVKNSTLGENSLINELGGAIKIHNEARATNQSITDYVAQLDMFTEKDIDVPTMAMAVMLDEVGFKKWVHNYNGTVGQTEMFGGVRTKENISDETLKTKIKNYEQVKSNIANLAASSKGKNGSNDRETNRENEAESQSTNQSSKVSIEEVTKLEQQRDAEIEKVSKPDLQEGNIATATNSTTYTEQAKEIADKIRAEELPSWLGFNDPNIVADGITATSLKNALADAVEIVGKLLDKGVDFKKAVEEGIKFIKDFYTKNGIAFNDKEISDGFTQYSKEKFSDYQSAKEVAEFIRNDLAGYNESINNKSQDFIDALNKELGFSGKVNFNTDAFKEQVRKLKSFGLSEAEIIDSFGSAKNLTKAQKKIVSETFAETAETDKIAKELNDAFKKIAQGEKPKAVLERLSKSNVTQLVNSLKDALTYTAISNEQLEKMADFVVESIDLNQAQDYINGMINNSMADVRQMVRAKLIIALQKTGNNNLAKQLIKDLADEATQSGRQTQSLNRVYQILGAQGNPSTRAEFARRSAEAVQEKARRMTDGYAKVISEQEVEIGSLNARLHQKAQSSSFINKLKDTIANICGLRNKK